MTQPFVFNYHLILVFFIYIVILRTFIYVRKEKYIWLKNRITFGKMTEILLLDDYEKQQTILCC